jgi:serine protease Do
MNSQKAVGITRAIALIVVIALAAGVVYLASLDGSERSEAEVPAAPLEKAQLHLLPLSGEFVAVSEKVLPSVVHVRAERAEEIRLPEEGLRFAQERFYRPLHERNLPYPDASAKGVLQESGSGVIIDKAGYVLTSSRVVWGADRIRVIREGGTEQNAELLGADLVSEVAVIKIPAGDDLPILELGNSDALRAGLRVLAVENPLGLGGTVAAGIVGRTGTTNVMDMRYSDLIRTDATVSSNGIGGPLVNLEGKVVGLMTKAPVQEGHAGRTGSALPVNIVHRMKKSLVDEGRVLRGWIGVRLEEGEGAVVIRVVEGGPAARAGLQESDVITSFQGLPIKNVHELITAVGFAPIGGKVETKFLRDGKENKVEIEVAELPLPLPE